MHLVIVPASDRTAPVAISLGSLIIVDIASLRIKQFSIGAEGVAESVKQRLVIFRLAIAAPSPAHVVCGIGERTDKRNPTFLLQRKEMLVVFKQYKGFGGDIPGNLAMSGACTYL